MFFSQLRHEVLPWQQGRPERTCVGDVMLEAEWVRQEWDVVYAYVSAVCFTEFSLTVISHQSLLNLTLIVHLHSQPTSLYFMIF